MADVALKIKPLKQMFVYLTVWRTELIKVWTIYFLTVARTVTMAVTKGLIKCRECLFLVVLGNS